MLTNSTTRNGMPFTSCLLVIFDFREAGLALTVNYGGLSCTAFPQLS